MGIENIASTAAAKMSNIGQNSEDSQISQLQRLEQTILRMENEYRVTARASGISGTGIQMKLREFDKLISKVDQQISDLQKEQKQSSDSEKNGTKRIGVSMLQYNTDATMVAMRNSGESLHTVLSKSADAVLAKTEASAVQRQAEQQAKEAVQQEEEKKPKAAAADTLNVLV